MHFIISKPAEKAMVFHLSSPFFNTQVFWLWQFQMFTNRKPCCKRGFARIALGWDTQ